MIRIIQSNLTYFYIICILPMLISCKYDNDLTISPAVEVRYTEGKAQLYRNGNPYFIKGASGIDNLEKVSAYGGNSIRTWSVHNAGEILDKAEALGLTVTLGLEIGRPYWGEDFKYWNILEVNKKIEELKPFIEKYKNHPALLMWGVGNEVSLKGGSRYLIYYTINRIAKMIKKTDPNHPVMTAINVKTIGRGKYLMPNVDILGYNGFGLIKHFFEDNKNYKNKGWGRAYIFSEWGVPGHWEVKDTAWGAPYELSTKQKINFLQQYWELMNQDTTSFLGSYAFYWGNKFEITNTWFSQFSTEGENSETVQYIQSLWKGEAFHSNLPEIFNISFNDRPGQSNQYLTADSLYSASPITDFDDLSALKFKWEIRPEEAKFYELDDYQHNMSYLMEADSASTLKFRTPKNEGPYRIYVYISDDSGNYTSHNLPFYVVNQ